MIGGMSDFLAKFMPSFGAESLVGGISKGSKNLLSAQIDWVLLFATLPIICAGLVTMNSFTGGVSAGGTPADYFFIRQMMWVGVSLIIFFSFSLIDFRFLRRTRVVVTIYVLCCLLLLALFVLGHVSRGAASWFQLGTLGIEPSDPAQLAMVLVLAKYFSRRHIEIANIRHIIVSGAYALIMFALILFQPDFGVAVIIFLIWLGMVLVSGISKRHLAVVVCVGLLAFGGLWFFGLKQYQKERIINFIHPLTNISGSGYNAYQSTIAVGSGQVIGKGLGYGTQSRLKFLPEYQTDFVFAAFAEEWGFVGVALLFLFFGIVVWRVLVNAMHGVSNFEILYGVGLAIYLMAHFVVNVGMNIGLLPVTGLVIPFMSYGGSHLVTEFAGLGILMGMRRYRRVVHVEATKQEFLGLE
jgi:rod shape determining protein RodA